jgi:hypothetical protein
MKKETKEVYIASDDKVFISHKECAEHELCMHVTRNIHRGPLGDVYAINVAEYIMAYASFITSVLSAELK